MIPWYLITNDDQPWRLPITLEHLSRFDLHVKVVHGFNGHLCGLRPINPHEMKPNGECSYAHPSVVGCVLSHLMALSTAIADEQSTFIVAEDDVLLSDDFNVKLDAVLSDLPFHVDMLSLEYTATEAQVGDEISPGVRRCWFPFGSACNWWRKETAERALRMLRPIDNAFDIMLIRKVYPFIGYAVAWPALATQRSGNGCWNSSIQGRQC